MLKVVIDSSLQPTDYESKLKKFDKSSISTCNAKSFDVIERHISDEDNLVKLETNNGFINAIVLAYNSHVPLEISPDNFHIMLGMVYSNIINNNAEALRHIFVEHEGKKELIARIPEYDLDEFCKILVQLAKNNIKDPEYVDLMSTNYSTTTPLSNLVANTVIMNSLKEYFDYTMMCMCGISSVILTGTIEDWEQVRHKYHAVKKYFTVLNDAMLNYWYQKMDILVDLFVNMRKLKVDGEVEATDYMKEVWKYVVSVVPQGSGGDTYIGGWLNLFVPFDGKNMKDFSTMNSMFKDDDAFPVPPKYNDDIGYYRFQDIEAKYYMANSWTSLSSSILETPVKLIDCKINNRREKS